MSTSTMAATTAPREVEFARRAMQRGLDDHVLSPATEAEVWITSLRADGPQRNRAISRLHELLLGAARHELSRRRAALSHMHGEEFEDLATQAADDALMAVLAKLDDYRGASRFSTWAYKFALLEAGVKVRRRAWQGREVVLESESWPSFEDMGASIERRHEAAELLSALQRAIREALTPHQREVFTALALNEVPIDVLSERMGATRGALYKTPHDARRKLRAERTATGHMEEQGPTGTTAWSDCSGPPGRISA